MDALCLYNLMQIYNSIYIILQIYNCIYYLYNSPVGRVHINFHILPNSLMFASGYINTGGHFLFLK